MKNIQRAGTAQSKMMDVAKGFGQSNIKHQQGTTRIIYDTLPLVVGQDIYEFFRNCNTRQFPFTNLQNGNRLEVGEMLTMQFGWLSILVIKKGEGDVPIEYQLIDISGGSLSHEAVAGTEVTAAWTAAENYLPLATKIALGELSFMVGNTQTLKPISLQGFHPSFNKSSKNEHNSVFTFDSILTIPPMLEFVAPVKVVPMSAADLTQAVPADIYLRLHLEGAAAIVAPRQTF